jgi:hypothetical protein
MSIRQIKRRCIGLMNRAEVFRTFDLLTGEYTGTWQVWRETRPARGRGKK